MLFKKVSEIDREKLPRENGVYLFRLNEKAALDGFENPDYFRIVYIGRAIKSSSIFGRFGRHIETSSKQTSSSGSTLRRSLGAIFKKKFSLKAYPRFSKKENKPDHIDNFNFILPENDYTKETILTNWMKENLEYFYIETKDAIELEKHLIKHLKPTLNDSIEHNPLRDKLHGEKGLRQKCKNEASNFSKKNYGFVPKN